MPIEKVGVSSARLPGTSGQGDFKTGKNIFQQLSDAAGAVSKSVSTELNTERKQVELNKADTRARAAFEHVQGIAMPEGADAVEVVQRELLKIDANATEWTNSKLGNKEYMTNTSKDQILEDLRGYVSGEVNTMENFTGHSDRILYAMQSKMAAALASSQAAHAKAKSKAEMVENVRKSYSQAGLQPKDVAGKINQAIKSGMNPDLARDSMYEVIAANIRANPVMVDQWQEFRLEEGGLKLSDSNATIRKAIADVKSESYQKYQTVIRQKQTDLYFAHKFGKMTDLQKLDELKRFGNETFKRFGVRPFTQEGLMSTFRRDLAITEAAIKEKANKLEAGEKFKITQDRLDERLAIARKVEERAATTFEQKQKLATKKVADDAAMVKIKKDLPTIIAMREAAVNKSLFDSNPRWINETAAKLLKDYGPLVTDKAGLKKDLRAVTNKISKDITDGNKDRAEGQKVADIFTRSRVTPNIWAEGYTNKEIKATLVVAKDTFRGNPLEYARWVGYSLLPDKPMITQFDQIANADPKNPLGEEYIRKGLDDFANLPSLYKSIHISSKTEAFMTNLAKQRGRDLTLDEQTQLADKKISAFEKSFNMKILTDEFDVEDMSGPERAEASSIFNEMVVAGFTDTDDLIEAVKTRMNNAWFDSEVGHPNKGSWTDLQASFNNREDLAQRVDQAKTYFMRRTGGLEAGAEKGYFNFDSTNNEFSFIEKDGLLYQDEEGRSFFDYRELLSFASKGNNEYQDSRIPGKDLGLDELSSAGRWLANSFRSDEEPTPKVFTRVDVNFEDSGVKELLLGEGGHRDGTWLTWGSGGVGYGFKSKTSLINVTLDTGHSYKLDASQGITEAQADDLFRMSMRQADGDLGKEFGDQYKDIPNETNKRFLSVIAYKYPNAFRLPKVQEIFKEAEIKGVDPTSAIFNYLSFPEVSGLLNLAPSQKDMENTTNIQKITGFAYQRAEFTSFIVGTANRFGL